MTGGEVEMVCGGPLYFSKTYWLSGALISVIHSHRRQFSVPRCNAHRAERLMEKEMKLITRSQTRRVIGKVCLMGFYEMYVLAARADTALMRRKLARSLYARAKLRNRQLKK